MKNFTAFLAMIAIVLLSVVAFAQKNSSPADNAALRYWAAFSQVQDSAITGEQAKELNAILDGTAPYVDSNYKDLLEKNKLALEIMARATAFPNCDWGLDYSLGDDVPVDYARKALVLGRLNVLYSFHLFINGNKDEAVRALTAGLRFSHDVGNGGSLFAALIAKDLLVNHLKAADGALHMEQLSSAQRSGLKKAVAELGQGIDWQTAAKLDLEALRVHYAGDSQSSAALTKIISSYVAFLGDQSKLPMLTQAIESAPPKLASLIPNAKRVLEQKQDLNDRLLQARSSLQ